MRLRLSAWVPLLDAGNLHHGRLRPILIRCRDDQAVRCSDRSRGNMVSPATSPMPTSAFQRQSRRCASTGCRSATNAPAGRCRRGSSCRLRLMHAPIRTSDLARFRTKSQDVCRIVQASTDACLTKDRIKSATSDRIKQLFRDVLSEALDEAGSPRPRWSQTAAPPSCGGNSHPRSFTKIIRGVLSLS
jgi:hypothetical protein